jgi:hypothetical protein
VAGEFDEEGAWPTLSEEGPRERVEGGFEGGPEGEFCGGGFIGDFTEAEGRLEECVVAITAECDEGEQLGEFEASLLVSGDGVIDA